MRIPDQATPLHVCAMLNAPGTAKAAERMAVMLLAAGAKVDAELTDGGHVTPLLVAASCLNEGVARALLLAGAHVSADAIAKAAGVGNAWCPWPDPSVVAQLAPPPLLCTPVSFAHDAVCPHCAIIEAMLLHAGSRAPEVAAEALWWAGQGEDGLEGVEAAVKLLEKAATTKASS